MQKIYLFLSLFIFNPFLFSQNRTIGLVDYSSKNQNGYCLYSPNGTKKTFLIDKCGRKIKEWTSSYAPGLSVSLQKDGSLYRAGVSPNIIFGGGTGGILEKFDWNGNVKWTYKLADSNNVLHHDFKVMPNGHILVIIWENHSKSDAVKNGRNPSKTSSGVWSERISEIEPSGTDSAIIHWEWRAWDHMVQDYDSTKLNYDVVANHRELFDINFSNGNSVNGGIDWFHFNSVDYHAQHDQILLTAHSLDEIYIIDHSATKAEAATHSGGRQKKGGDVLYRWGNPASYQTGSSANRKLYKQHHAHWALNDNVNSTKIFIYNNGSDRPGSKYTSLISIVPPVSPDGSYSYTTSQPFGPTVENTEYKAKNPTDFFSNIMGGFYQIGPNRFWVTDATHGTVMEIYNDTIVWKYINPFTGTTAAKQGTTIANNYVFRFQYYPANFAAFDGKTLTPGDEIELEPKPTKLCEPPLSTYLISRINKQQTISGIADSIGLRCRINGVVQSKNLTEDGLFFFFADQSGSISVKNINTFNYTPKPGDSLFLQGKISQKNGWVSFLTLDTLILMDSMKGLQDAIPAKPSENNESKKVQLNKMRLKDPSVWPAASLPKNTYVSVALLNTDNSVDSMRIYSGSNIEGNKPFNKYFTVAGFTGQNDPSTPYTSGYFLTPTDISDFKAIQMPTVSFKTTVDTLTENKASVTLSFVGENTDDYSFDVVVLDGNAVASSDYQFTAQTINVSNGLPISNIDVLYGNNPDFTGVRFVRLSIRNITEPAEIGADSIVVVYINGKKANGLVSTELLTDINVFPNTSNGTFNIQTSKTIKHVQLHNNSGRLAYQLTGQCLSPMVLESNLPAGMYLLTVYFQDGGMITKQVVLQH